MNDSDNPDFKKHIKATQQAGDNYFTATILPFTKQFLLTVAIYLIFWNHLWWLKWTLFLTAPVCIYNIHKIYQQRRYLQDRIEEMKGMINELHKEPVN